MRRVILAIRAFFLILFRHEVAAKVAPVLDRQASTGSVSTGSVSTGEKPSGRARQKQPSPPRPARSEALTLLATLQREARFVDFIMEPLGGYADAQIGAVARDVHRDCGKVLQRLFALQPVLSEEEGVDVEVPAGFDAGRYRLTGNVAGEPPFRGQLMHAGWEATSCELPSWSGAAASARVVTPVEVELK